MIFRDAKKDELEKIAELQTQSYRNDPLFKIFVKNEKKRLKFNRAILETMIKASHKHHVVFVCVQDEQITAAAVVKPIDKPEISLLKYIASGGFRVFLTGGIKNTFGFLEMLKEARSKCHENYPNSWFLTALTVSDSCQGQGIGSKMIHDCIKPYIARNGGGVLTFITNTEINRTFYQKNGCIEFHGMSIRRKNIEISNWSYKLEIAPEL